MSGIHGIANVMNCGTPDTMMTSLSNTSNIPPSINHQMGGSNSQLTILSTSGGHISVRDTVGGSTGSSSHIPSLRGGSSGPIRNKHRKDTSPYGSDRMSTSNVHGSTNSSHLSPPDSSGAWRRVRSDPFLHSSVSGGNSTGVSPAGSMTDTPTACLSSNGAISPLHGASPTLQRRGMCVISIIATLWSVSKFEDFERLFRIIYW
jgi:hypothetical protein